MLFSENPTENYCATLHYTVLYKTLETKATLIFFLLLSIKQDFYNKKKKVPKRETNK